MLAEIDEAAEFVRGRVAERPGVGLVLGSGLGAFAETLDDAATIPFAEIPRFPTSTAVGHRGELVVGRSEGIPVAALAGRVHHYEGYSAQQVVFPVRVLGRLGARMLVVTNAAGGINPDFRPGDLMVISDHLNLTGTSPLIGPNEPELGERFPDLTDAYDPALQDMAVRICREAGVAVQQGVYAGLAGPAYETPAEIRMLRTLGADAVGMSTVLEVIAARHMGLRCLGLSCVTNAAAGITGEKLSHDEVLEVSARMRAALIDVLRRIVIAAAADG